MVGGVLNEPNDAAGLTGDAEGGDVRAIQQATKQEISKNHMQQRSNHIANMLKTVLRFVLEHPITPALAVVTQLIAVITATVAAFEAAAEDQTEGDGEATGGVRTKRMKQKQLRAYLKDVARVGRSLDPEEFPGLGA